MNSNPAEIGNRIKEARKAAKLSQTDLAVRLDKTLRTVQKYESGEIKPSIAMINSIALILKVSPAELIGYQRQQIRLDTLADVMFALNELNKKAGLRFEIDVKRSPHYDEWSCAIRFDGNSKEKFNGDMCLFLERYAEERELLETYWKRQYQFDRWFESELAYYAIANLADREPLEDISESEQLRRRNQILTQMVEAQKKAAEENGDQ